MGLVSSISSVIGKNESAQQAKAYLMEIDDSGHYDLKTIRAFQYFPESIRDSKGGEYVEKTVIGSSHPIYQWLHGSRRAISFETILSTDYRNEKEKEKELSLSGILQEASSWIKNPVSAAIATYRPNNDSYNPDGTQGRNVNIADGIAWFRSKLYPTYKDNEKVKPPPKLFLVLEGTQIASYVGSYKTGGIPCIMSSCDVTYNAFFQDGTPRLATLSMEFLEIVQLGKSWSWVSRSSFNANDNKYQYGKGEKPKGIGI